MDELSQVKRPILEQQQPAGVATTVAATSGSQVKVSRTPQQQHHSQPQSAQGGFGGGGGGGGGGRKMSRSNSQTTGSNKELHERNLTFMQLFYESIFDNILLISTIGAVFVGCLIGAIMRNAAPADGYSDQLKTLLAFPGDLFLRMLKVLILPLIIASVISALASLDSTVSGKIGMRSCLLYLTTTITATITGIILVTLIHPGDVGMKANVMETTSLARGKGKVSTADAIADLVRSIIPDNIVSACFQHSETVYVTQETRVPDNRGGYMTKNETVRKFEHRDGANVLGLIAFCCVFGIICSKLGEKAALLVEFFQALDNVVMQMVMLAMYFSPIGIASLIIDKFITIDDMGATMSRLGLYMVTVIVGLILHGFISIPTMYGVLTRKNPLTFMRKCTECIIFAIGTGSSTATLPVTFKCLEENVKCDTRVTRFVLPIGATINMDGTALYEAVAAIFIGQMNGMTFSFTQLIIISLTSTAASVGAAAVPSAGLVTMIMVLTAVGLPTEDITMIVAVDWFLDRLRTAVNVLSDGYVAGIVAHMSKGELDRYDAEHGTDGTRQSAESQGVGINMQNFH
ncbi:Excitatory amino acid transporter 2 [Fragariocoptes setiger]|uniref:Amino acid transporter n=1 Tax=Fragariocoptes setiger TaxID=1670756 RepID=A0ABQ7SCK0_9ACAR|nr:Excitatory amino acid transporter 2 [Fragariocoptes setiger]